MTPLSYSLSRPADLPAALDAMGLAIRQPALVIVGGAGGMSPELILDTGVFFENYVVPFVIQNNIAVIDGGTNAGVMEAIGIARANYKATFPLIGVVVESLVRSQQATLQKDHSHFLYVPGENWGDEVKWLAATATALTGAAALHGHVAPSATVLINGGNIAWNDVEASTYAGRPVFVAEGSGRTADAIATTLTGINIDARAVKLLASGKFTSINPYVFPDKFMAALSKVYAAK
jgi:hypothetical protein